MSDDNRENIWEYGNRIDDANHRASMNERVAQQKAEYAAEREREYNRASREYAERPAPPPARRSPLMTSVAAAFAGFLILLWGVQVALFQLSAAMGARTLDAGLAAVGRVNGMLVGILLVGVALGWLAWARRRGWGRVLGSALLAALIALGAGAWQIVAGAQGGAPAASPATAEAGATIVAAPATQDRTATDAAPQATTAPAPAAAPEIRVVTADALLLRAEPSTAASVLARLSKGAEVTLLGEAREAGGIRWVRVSTRSGEGWVSAAYIAGR